MSKLPEYELGNTKSGKGEHTFDKDKIIGGNPAEPTYFDKEEIDEVGSNNNNNKNKNKQGSLGKSEQNFDKDKGNQSFGQFNRGELNSNFNKDKDQFGSSEQNFGLDKDKERFGQSDKSERTFDKDKGLDNFPKDSQPLHQRTQELRNAGGNFNNLGDNNISYPNDSSSGVGSSSSSFSKDSQGSQRSQGSLGGGDSNVLQPATHE